jgi:hypothetical protein
MKYEFNDLESHPSRGDRHISLVDTPKSHKQIESKKKFHPVGIS